nr:leucine-rich repeat protein [Eubacterium sp.]
MKNIKMKRSPFIYGMLLLAIIFMGTTPNYTKVEAAEENVQIMPTEADQNVIPDKYNTGCTGALTVPVESVDSRGKTNWVIEDVVLVPSGSGDNIVRVFDFYYRNKEVSGEVVFNDIDFSDMSLRLYNDGLVERDIHLVFNNCKFSGVSMGKGDSKVTYEFNHCSFRSFYGSNATFNRCKFGGSYSDGMVPFRNVEVNDCYFSDMTHMATGGEVHTDGTQIYGDKDHDVCKVHFSRCRFEVPALNLPDSTAYVNACIMLQLEFSSGSDISFRDCIVNGGSNTVFAWSTKGDWGLENVVFDGLRFGNAYKHGMLDSRISPEVNFKNLSISDELYVSSVWQDDEGTHLSVTNDSGRDKELVVCTDKGTYTYEIGGFDKTAENAWQTLFQEMPFDKEIIIPESVSYVVCFSRSFPGCAKQVRFVNFQEENDVYLDKAVLDELTGKENEILLEGSCGKDVTYTLTYGGVLTLSGTGNTDNFHSKKFPEWYVAGVHDYRDCIKEIVVEEGIQGIGNALFAKCSGVEKISLPDSLRSIGQYAFDGCVCVDSVTLPANIEQLGTSVFRGMQLKEIYYEGEDWEQIEISKGNDVLNNNAKYYADGALRYRVVYTLNDAEESPATHTNPLTFSTGDQFEFADPQREGYTFDGWFSDSKFVKKITGLEGTETDNVRVYAKWTENVSEDSSGAGASAVTKPSAGAQNSTTGTQGKESVDTQNLGTVHGTKPKKVQDVKVKKKSSSSVKIRWKRDKEVSGYEIRMKKGKKGTFHRIKTIKKNKKVSFTKKKLKKGKVYYFKVRAYKMLDGKKIYGAYSKVKKIRMK